MFAQPCKFNKKMVRIRLAIEEDKKTIAAFQLEMAQETENLLLNMSTLLDGVTAVFRDPTKGKYLVAEVNKKVIATMLLTPEWSDWRNKWVLWIQSVYVIPEFRGKGVFKALYGHARKMVNNDGQIAGMRLYVDTSNKNASQVYKAVGMDGDHYRVFEWMKNPD